MKESQIMGMNPKKKKKNHRSDRGDKNQAPLVYGSDPFTRQLQLHALFFCLIHVCQLQLLPTSIMDFRALGLGSIYIHISRKIVSTQFFNSVYTKSIN